jgi:hypothetical protein
MESVQIDLSMCTYYAAMGESLMATGHCAVTLPSLNHAVFDKKCCW